MKVRLDEIAPTGGYSAIIDLEAVPRLGENIVIGERVMEIRTVFWTPDSVEHVAHIRFR